MVRNADTTQTPSPHRFLPGRRSSLSKEDRPIPGPRAQFNPAQAYQPASTQPLASQFAPTPRFGKIRGSSQAARPPSPRKPALVQALQASGRVTEDVEDAPIPNEEDDEMLDDEQAQAMPTTEDEEAGAPWTNDLALSPKRRRLDMGPEFSSPERPTFRPPQTPASHFAKSMPRVHSQTQDAISTQATASTPERPAFLRPSLPPQEPSEPLPDAFSPHRRGQKFVPGGMAATMQQWVIDTGQAAVQSRKGQAYLKGEDYVLRVKAEDIAGHGPYVVQGKDVSGDVVDLVLAGTGQGTEVKPGVVIGIRAPSWDLELDGKTYAVGVDWRTLS